MKNKNINQESKEAADYGTLMHTLIAEFVSDGLFNLDNIESRCYQFLMQTGRPLFLLQSWAKKLRKDLLAFAQCSNLTIINSPIVKKIYPGKLRLGYTTMHIEGRIAVQPMAWWCKVHGFRSPYYARFRTVFYKAQTGRFKDFVFQVSLN